MAQPLNRNANVDPVVELDADRGEIWLQNPWKVGETNENLSAYEPNQIFLNMDEGPFANIGYLTTADLDGDGRGALVADFTGDLQPDLLVRSSGGGPVRVFENRFPRVNRLVVSLEGTRSNRLGIGATVEVEVGGKRIARQLFPENNFVTTQGCEVRFGLGSADKIDRVTVLWPTGETQEWRDIPVNTHVRLVEDSETVEVLRTSHAE